MTQVTFDQQLLPPANSLEAFNGFMESSNPLLLLISHKAQLRTEQTQYICQHFRHRFCLIQQHADVSWQPWSFIKTLAHLTKVPPPRNDERLESYLQTFLNHLGNKKESFLLVIDSAQKLSLAVLAAISHLAILQENNTVKLHILLVGEKDLSKKVANVQTREVPLVDLDEGVIPISGLTEEVTIENSSQFFSLKPAWHNHKVKLISSIGLILVGLILLWLRQHSLPNILSQRNKTIKIKPIAQPIKSVVPITKPGYTIQLMASQSLTKIQNYLQKNYIKNLPTSNQAFYPLQISSTHIDKFHIAYKQERNGKWYLLLYDHFTTYSAAKKMLASLPKNLQKLNPWIRSEPLK